MTLIITNQEPETCNVCGDLDCDCWDYEPYFNFIFVPQNEVREARPRQTFLAFGLVGLEYGSNQFGPETGRKDAGL
jgi:hypothetical protein